MQRTIQYVICENDFRVDGKLTVERFLRSKGYTRQSITELKKYHNSTMIDGQWVHMSRELRIDEQLTVQFDECDSSEKIVPTKLPFPIVYEDEDIAVVDKPACMPIHPSLNNYENTLANAAAYYYMSKNQKLVFRCINRLDRDTTGLTIIAKHFVSAGVLYNQMKNRQIKREYIAIVSGCMEKDEGTVNAPIGRCAESTIERCIDWENGEEAITHYKVISKNQDLSLVTFKLDTGRTHQIRVHMKYLGHPLIGDWLYNVKDAHMSRQALHSRSLDFIHPITGKEMHFEADMPKDMAEVIKKHKLFTE